MSSPVKVALTLLLDMLSRMSLGLTCLPPAESRNWWSWSESAGSRVTTNTELPNLTSYLAPVLMGEKRAGRSQL